MNGWYAVGFFAFSLFTVYALFNGYYEWLLVITIIGVTIFLRYAR